MSSRTVPATSSIGTPGSTRCWYSAQGLVLAVGGHGGEGVEPAVEGGDLLVGVAERCAESGNDVVAGNVAGGWGGGLPGAGVPFLEDRLGAVDGGVADCCFAGEVLLGQGAVGALRGPVEEALHCCAKLGVGGWGDRHVSVLACARRR
jgi:hypothetical protein